MAYVRYEIICVPFVPIMHSDAERLVDGKWERVPLHFNKEKEASKVPRLTCIRGTKA